MPYLDKQKTRRDRRTLAFPTLSYSLPGNIRVYLDRTRAGTPVVIQAIVAKLKQQLNDICEGDEAPVFDGRTYLVQPRSIASLMAHTIG